MSQPIGDCAEHRLALGAYVLGSLDDTDRAVLDRHLITCQACTAELSELAGVVPVLSSVTPEELDVEPARLVPSPDLFDRIVAAVDADTHTPGGSRSGAPAPARRPRSRPDRLPRRRLILVAACAAAVLGAGVGTGFAVFDTGSSTAHSTAVSATAHGVRLQVTATDAASGTLLNVTVEGLPKNEHCRLIAFAADRSRHDAGTWNATYEGRAQITESTDVARASLRRLVLYGTQGQVLVGVDI